MIVSFFYCRVIPAAKIVLSIANLFLMIAIILVPIGFAFLDDSCPGTDEMQCGIACGDANDDFSYFTLCGPYEVGVGWRGMLRTVGAFLAVSSHSPAPNSSTQVGDSLWVLIVGIILIFISSFFAACIRLQTTIVEEQGMFLRLPWCMLLSLHSHSLTPPTTFPFTPQFSSDAPDLTSCCLHSAAALHTLLSFYHSPHENGSSTAFAQDCSRTTTTSAALPHRRSVSPPAGIVDSKRIEIVR